MSPVRSDPPAPDSRARANLRAAMRAFYRGAPEYEVHVGHRPADYFARYRDTWRACLPPVDLVLEIGAGSAEALAPLVEEGRIRRLLALELGSRNLKLIAARAGSVRGFGGDALDLPIADGSVDAVTSFQVLEHLPSVPDALSEALRVLRRPGHLVIGIPNHASLSTPLGDFVHGRTRGAFGVRSRSGALRWWTRNLAITMRKRAQRRPRYLYRDPALDPDTRGGDHDAVYYACPLDLLRDLADRGAHLVGTDAVVRWGPLGRLVPWELRGSIVAVWRID